jgi:peptidoglycan/LPS O-acetylase OafA/YrhL
MPDNFTSDFFNNAAAVSVGLLFAKMVSHRLKTVSPHLRTQSKSPKRPFFHFLAVVTALAALGVALFVSHTRTTWGFLHGAVWFCLALSALILVGDELAQDFYDIKRGRTNEDSQKPDTSG